MSTKLPYVLLLFVLMGCSNDDGDRAKDIPADQKFVDRIDITTENGAPMQVADFEYDQDKRLSNLAITSLFSMAYTYEDGQLTSIHFLGSEGRILFGFEYDGTGRMETMTKDGIPLPLIYDDMEKTYTVDLGEDGTVVYTINGNEDVEEIRFFNGQGLAENTISYVYTAAPYKGTMANTMNIQLATAMIIGTEEEYLNSLIFLLSYVSHRPMVNFAFSGGGVYTISNTYDDQNFLDTFVLQFGSATGETNKVIYEQIE